MNKLLKYEIGNVFFVAIILVLASVSCGEDETGPSKRGRNLEIHADIPVIVNQAYYRDDDGNYRLLVPSASNRQLVIVNVTVVNRTSTIIPFNVDPEAVQLGDRRGKRYNAVDPVERSRVLGSVLEDDIGNKNIHPLLWGDIELARKFQVAGYIAFDVPKGLILGTLFWDEIEYIPVDFLDYWKKR